MNKKNTLTMLLLFIACTLLTTTTNALEISNINEYLYAEYTQTISMDFKDARLNDVLKIFSQQSSLNFIASTEVSDKMINLYLDKVPVEEALERILSANNLTYELKTGSNIFVVKPLDLPKKTLITRVYNLKFATVPSSKINSTLSLSSDSEESDSSSTTEEGSSSSKNGIMEAIQSLLTEDGSVIEDPRTNSIIVTDIPSQFPLIEQTIARLDIRIPQILIEVEMLDITKSTADLLGFKYGDTPVTFTGGERDSIYPFDRNHALDKGFSFEEAEYRVSTLSFSGLQLSLQFLKTQTDTKNLARPRILTLNNQTAEINIKTDEAIGIASSTTSSEGTAETVEEAERVETGVFLKVTPQANVDTGEIVMAVEPKVIQARTGQTFGTQTFKDPEERGSKSILRIKDGDTIIIGGLVRGDNNEVKTKVPGLGSIPFVGALFRHKDDTGSERELIIFITPHIVKEDLASLKSSPSVGSIVREQDIPLGRLQQIEKELSIVENQRF